MLCIRILEYIPQQWTDLASVNRTSNSNAKFFAVNSDNSHIDNINK